MENIRWYDKNPKLKEVFEFIKSLDESTQKSIAQEIIQILMNDAGLDSDEQINTISKNYNFECQRWYDKNIDLFTSFEIIKNLSEDVQNKIVGKIIETVLLIYFKKGIAE